MGIVAQRGFWRAMDVGGVDTCNSKRRFPSGMTKKKTNADSLPGMTKKKANADSLGNDKQKGRSRFPAGMPNKKANADSLREWQRKQQTQIPFGNDKKKGKRKFPSGMTNGGGRNDKEAGGMIKTMRSGHRLEERTNLEMG